MSGILGVLMRLEALERDNSETASDASANGDSQTTGESTEPAADRKPLSWRKNSAELLAYVRVHRKLAKTSEQHSQDSSDSLLRKVNDQLAVRNCDLHGLEGVRACAGRGKYRTWTAAAMLRCVFGHPSKGASSHVPSPCQFSCSSTAFWFGCASSYVQKIRNSICNMYLGKQTEAMREIGLQQLQFKKLALEWDETGQLMNLRTSMLEKVRGVFPVCIQRWTCSYVKQGGLSLLHTELVIPPAVMKGGTANQIWGALNTKGPVPVWNFFGATKCGLLYLMSDRCNTNLSIINHCIASKPAHVAVASHPCNLHETHHGSRAIFLRQAFVNSMFCASNVMRSGPAYKDLLSAIRAAMRKSFRVSFDPPDPRNADFAREVINVTYLNQYDALITPGSEDRGERFRRRQEKAEDLLKILNGDWRSPWVTHHCKLGCCRNSKERSTSRFCGFKSQFPSFRLRLRLK